MEFNKPIVALSFILCMLCSTYASGFPAIFNFGDSNSDTGGLSAAFSPRNSPYGQTFFQMPVGRCSDGRLIIDFIAESFNLPYLSSYLNSLGANYTHGANFATASSTITVPPSIIPQAGGFSPFNLDVQYEQFLQFMTRSQIIKEQGGTFAELMPEKDYFGKALYTFDIGQNDLAVRFLDNMTVKEVKAIVPDIVDGFSENVKKIYNLGARSFWIHNTGPIGCLSFILEDFPSAKKDNAGCAEAYNEVAQLFNLNLKSSICQLRIDLPLASFTYVDIYSIKYSLYSEPQKHGFEFPHVACCGYGGKYNYSSVAECGDRVITEDGNRIVVDACPSPANRVMWDGVHYTEAANRYVFDQISTGAFLEHSAAFNMPPLISSS
ncbi:esterase [Manihot esculenta]|uniref:Uncharacterized protein n=1 Tax=Manihot esculenta TaxID=3983 RepID=A0A2C9WEG1_MANES|nr:esterase [Manihot esculenta]OAY58265.1 hypothetical protein MANES_02G163100v8 [Manihot esculenta]